MGTIPAQGATILIHFYLVNIDHDPPLKTEKWKKWAKYKLLESQINLHIIQQTPHDRNLEVKSKDILLIKTHH